MATEIGITGLAATLASPINSQGSPPVRGGPDRVWSGATVDKPSADEAQIRGEFARIQGERDARAEQAIGLREGARNLDALQAKLEETRDRLTAIVKHYPPYGKDNPVRIELLNQVSGLRKQIEALITPAEKLADKVALPAQAAPFDFAPLDPSQASDEEVAATLSQVEAAQAGLAQLRSGMWADIVAADSGQSEQDAAMRTQASQAYLAQIGRSLTTSQDVLTALG